MALKELGFGFILWLGGSSPLLATVLSSFISFVFLSFRFWFALYFRLTDCVLFFNVIILSSLISYSPVEAEEVISLCM